MLLKSWLWAVIYYRGGWLCWWCCWLHNQSKLDECSLYCVYVVVFDIAVLCCSWWGYAAFCISMWRIPFLLHFVCRECCIFLAVLSLLSFLFCIPSHIGVVLLCFVRSAERSILVHWQRVPILDTCILDASVRGWSKSFGAYPLVHLMRIGGAYHIKPQVCDGDPLYVLAICSHSILLVPDICICWLLRVWLHWLWAPISIARYFWTILLSCTLFCLHWWSARLRCTSLQSSSGHVAYHPASPHST